MLLKIHLFCYYTDDYDKKNFEAPKEKSQNITRIIYNRANIMAKTTME